MYVLSQRQQVVSILIIIFQLYTGYQTICTNIHVRVNILCVYRRLTNVHVHVQLIYMIVSALLCHCTRSDGVSACCRAWRTGQLPTPTCGCSGCMVTVATSAGTTSTIPPLQRSCTLLLVWVWFTMLPRESSDSF